MPEKSLLAKLLLKPGVKMAIVSAPKGQPPPAGAELVSRGKAAVVLLYARNGAELDGAWDKARARLDDDGRLWVAYPKSGKLDTDLSRDLLAARLRERGFDTVRQVAIDETWSALWFKPLE
jgi:hypothetical protein